MNWTDALAKAAALFDGCPDCGGTNMDCGLTDGSIAGQWRLPNLRELQSLVHYGEYGPALPDTAGTGKASGGTRYRLCIGFPIGRPRRMFPNPWWAWVVFLNNGKVFVREKDNDDHYYAWPVRGGQ